jgi:uncharacterized protein
MGNESSYRTGAITWTDLTVKNADEVKKFYSEVVGWESEPVEMGDYSDFNMKLPDGGEAVAGICHARGVNAALPAQWLVYIIVDDIERSASRCLEMGGKIIAGIKVMGSQGRYCVIEDPSGAVAALFEPTKK